jgi:WD40 repeat protein
MNADGTNQLRLTNNTVQDVEPAWSPDGSKIVFVKADSSQTDLYTIKPDGTGETNITNTPASSEYSPDWQPLVGYARPRGATPTTVKLVPAFDECSSANASHGAPLSAPSCSPPAQSSDHVTVGTPDANGKAANAVGSVHLRVYSCPQCASPLPADVFITAELTDVRKGDLSDYTGELEGRLVLRITDRYNGSTLDWPATVTDAPISFSITCTATESSNVGSTCATSTSANAIMPGLVRDYARAVWQLGQVQVYDGGADGDGDTTGDNTLFAVQGLFAP